MIELRFPRAVYAGAAVDQAVKTFAAFAAFELSEEPEHWRVRLSAHAPGEERRLAGELGNYALGVTIDDLEPLAG
jgi:hypothetical protein